MNNKGTMKTFLGICLLFSFGMLTCAQENKPLPATVEKVEGVPVFVYALPADDYEVVGKAVSAGHTIRLAVDEISTVREKTVQLVRKALERKENGKVPAFDAIIIDLDKEKTQAIKFKESSDPLKAKVLDQDGVPVYFFSKPDGAYTVVADLQADYSLRAERGLLYDKIKSMVNRTLRKEESGEVEKFDAVIINPDDLSEQLIRFGK